MLPPGCKVTAAWLRSVGANVPADVPDVAVIVLAGIDVDSETSSLSEFDDKITLSLQFRFASPFHWQQSEVTLEDGTRITATLPPEA